MPPTLKLTYFDLPARAEGTRMMLRIAGVPFEDERVPRDAFPELKATLPYGQVPILTIDGQVLAETQAIQRYVARITGMYPLDDPLAALMVEEIVTVVSNAYETKVIASFRETDDDKRRAMREAMTRDFLPRMLRQVEAQLVRMAAYPYFQQAPNKLFLHDVVISRFVTTLASGRVDHVPATIADGYALVNEAHQKVLAAVEKAPVAPSPSIVPKTTRPQTIKLTYFDIPARAEFIRLALHVGGIVFDDERIAYGDISALKPTLPYGQLPVLTIDGHVAAESFALVRYASWIAGLYPVDKPLAAARMDEIIARVEEVYHAFAASCETKDPEERRALREPLLAANVIPKIFTSLEKRIEQWKQSGPFIFGESLSVADLAVYHIVDFIKSGDFDYVPVTLADPFTTVVGIHTAVVNHPRVQDWYATRAKP